MAIAPHFDSTTGIFWKYMTWSPEAQGVNYHLSGEFMGPTFSSSLFGVDFESGYWSAKLGSFSEI